MTDSSTDELTTEEAAAILKVRTDYLTRLARKGKLGRKFARSWIFTRAEVLAYDEERKPGRPRKST